MKPLTSVFSTKRADKIEDLIEEDRLLDLEAVEADNEDDDEYVDDEQEEEGWQATTNFRTIVPKTKDLAAGKPQTSRQPRMSKLERDLKQLSIEDITFGGTGKSKNTKKIIIHSDSEEKQDEVPSLPVVKKKR